MGYDMVWADVWAEHDDARWAELRDPNNDPPWYFRLNIGGMSRTRPVMAELGMIHGVGEDGIPPWTRCPCEDQCEHNEPVLRYAPEVPGIPEWKLGSNDPWLISSVEILGALHMLDRNGPPTDPPEWWDDWVAFLRSATEHGGVRQG
jgi:hypothetical protein